MLIMQSTPNTSEGQKLSSVKQRLQRDLAAVLRVKVYQYDVHKLVNNQYGDMVNRPFWPMQPIHLHAASTWMNTAA